MKFIADGTYTRYEFSAFVSLNDVQNIIATTKDADGNVRMLDAVDELRRKTGAGLKEAKDIIEHALEIIPKTSAVEETLKTLRAQFSNDQDFERFLKGLVFRVNQNF